MPVHFEDSIDFFKKLPTGLEYNSSVIRFGMLLALGASYG